MTVLPLWIQNVIYFSIAFGTSLFLGPIVIPRLQKLNIGQAIREEGPKEHLKKGGTPTIGGLIFIVSLLFVMLIFLIKDIKVWFVVGSMLAFGAIGFIDDYLKVIKKHNLGLRSKQKIILQLIVSSIFAVIAMGFGTDLKVPFTGNSIDLMHFYVPFIIFYYLAVDNSVNLTDGLDGLSTSVTIVVLTSMSVFAYIGKEWMIMSICVALVGALVGYLKYNWHPAKIFMGDTGSLALGGFIASSAIILKIPLFIPIIGIIYVAESLSVILQVGHYKRTKKRLFKMAPIHHHFELSGLTEVKIVIVFTAISAVFSIIGICAL